MSFKRDLELVVFVFCAVFWYAATFSPVMSEPIKDKEALLNFISKMDHSHAINWKKSTSLCKEWIGVQCNNDESQVVGLRLAEIGLHGSIPVNTLGRLSGLETLSLGSNYISGSFPSDFQELRNLNSLYLENNGFSGPLPLDFSVWKNLSIIDLSNNAFNGSIPRSISNMTHLTTLNLANNSLSGEIPDLHLPSLQDLDLSNNFLTGNVPQSLQRFPSRAFSGNNLVPKIKNAVPPIRPGQSPNAKPSKKGTTTIGEAAILGIIIGGSAMGLVIAVTLMVMCCSNRRVKNNASSKLDKQDLFVKKKGSETQSNSLKFFRSQSLEFDLEDLLRASSEVLGKGTSGTTYKATLEDGNAVAVKRLKEVSVSKKEFEQQMEVVGSIEHENVCGLRAYYYSKDEKLMVFDFYQRGSVSAMLHVAREKGQSPLDWETRLRIAIGAARGIARIHSQNCGKLLVHGNIKASNVFLNSHGYGCVTDAGVAALMNLMAPPATRSAGYRAPELKDSRKASQASDTYSFGVVLLELLTGKFPLHTKGGNGGDQIIHLVRWVNAVVREEWTAEVFDVELLRYPNIEEEMLETLQIALSCVGRVPDDRPAMADVAARLEGVRRVSGVGSLPPVLPPALERGAEELIQIQVNVGEGDGGAPSRSN
ncbi:probable inactive receptor kinase At4g23740 [Cucumis sativus]|uniref:Protein kinase domain-containing protein n=1 Tax=Cucumis sativus TaxID=3659 RepID=A0A0A0KJX6_CUCSA|nr:probable inactive receptor kinase At4g23740 [Cucumis sativus]XP_031741492.1 probable inactive receptor kinase At4g23740 [Cucumis sativus]KGN49888.1 hypothetical protein Csa_000627 [Cucumis sativus]